MKAVDIAQKHVDRIAEKRQRQWQWIKDEWPELADHLVEMREVFGKPKSFELRRKK